MTILATSLYRQGVCISRRDGGCCARPVADGGDFVWIDLADPTPSDLLVLRPAYDLSRLAVMEALDATRHVRCERLGEFYSINVPFASAVDPQLGRGSVAALLGPRYVITISHGRCRGRQRLADGSAIDADLPRPGPGYVLHAFLSEMIGDYDRALRALRDDVIACGQQALSAAPATVGQDRASRLRVQARSVAETLHRLDESRENLCRHVAQASDRVLDDLFAHLFGRVRQSAASADTLLEVLETMRECLDHQGRDDPRRHGLLLATSFLISAVLLIATRSATAGTSAPALGLWIGVAHFTALVLVVLCITTILIAHLTRRPGRRKTLQVDPQLPWRES